MTDFLGWPSDKRRKLRILVVADAKIPVPPQGYGGTERVIAHLVDGFAAAGHDVTLMAHPQSRVEGRVVGYRWSGREGKIRRSVSKLAFMRLFVHELMLRPDVVIANCRIDYLTPMAGSSTPLIYRFANPIAAGEIESLRRLKVAYLRIVALTNSHAAPLGGDPDAKIIGNCVDLTELRSSANSGSGYLAFLGRLTRNKGLDTAIRVARITGHPLLIAGNVSDEDGGYEFFETEVRPNLDQQVKWIGEISDSEKPAFLGNARALLMPIRWEEPFGIVVSEALACGTPVIAAPRGSMPELIRPGENGFLATTDEEFATAISKLSYLDRASCRADAEARFARGTMVKKYCELIAEVLSSKENNSVTN